MSKWHVIDQDAINAFGNGVLIRERETLDDLMRGEHLLPRQHHPTVPHPESQKDKRDTDLHPIE